MKYCEQLLFFHIFCLTTFYYNSKFDFNQIKVFYKFLYKNKLNKCEKTWLTFNIISTKRLIKSYKIDLEFLKFLQISNIIRLEPLMINCLRFIILEITEKKKFKNLISRIIQQQKDKFIYLFNNQEQNKNTINNKVKTSNNLITSLKSIKN